MSDRAKQFCAFSPLKGYHELLKSKEKVVVSRRELTEEHSTELSLKLNELKKGMVVEVIHYVNGEYLSTTGFLSKIDINLRKLTIIKTQIAFDDIYDIKVRESDGY